eukprot:TRINITY_DN2041_c0_g4_i1.p1 TRINITY_DN2041_c0_g4~~TRINITY_DN2041_c0_g4_i1.p1  ORF type:complete len:438 (+),score=142.05 TRINITY_DN2041_c0_g4_i1:267-1580(+)
MEIMNTLTRAIQKETGKGDWAALENLFTPQHTDFIRKNPQCIGMMLGHLDVVEHSAGWGHILSRANPATASRSYLELVEKFFAGMNVSQIREACTRDSRIGLVSHIYTEMCIALKIPGRGVPHLLHGIQRLRPSTDHLTPLHADYVCLCLLQKHYALAADLLGSTIYDVSAKQCGTTPRDFLLYYYYGGLVYIGLKEFDKAGGFLETCICCPATCLSAIVVEAYKKLVLVTLIRKGKAYVFPKHCPTVVSKAVGRFCSEYLEFAMLFEGASTNVAMLGGCIANHQALFVADKNLGLVKQAQAAFVSQQVSKLTLTYDTLSLEDIASSVGLASAEEAEKCLVRMVAKGQVCAQIDEHKQVAHFEDPASTSSQACTALPAEIAIIKHLTERMARVDDNLKCSKEYATMELCKDPEVRGHLMAHKKKQFNLMDLFSSLGK